MKIKKQSFQAWKNSKKPQKYKNNLIHLNLYSTCVCLIYLRSNESTKNYQKINKNLKKYKCFLWRLHIFSWNLFSLQDINKRKNKNTSHLQKWFFTVYGHRGEKATAEALWRSWPV